MFSKCYVVFQSFMLHIISFLTMVFREVILINYCFQVLQGLEAATSCVEDMEEWLGIFNVKLRHMREDIESVGTCISEVECIICLPIPKQKTLWLF